MKMEPIIFWIGLIILFLIVEIITVGLTSIWFAGGALAAVIAERAGGPIWLQVVLFFAVSFVLLYFTRPWAMKFVKPKNVKTNYEEVEGKTVRVTRRVDNIAGTGTVVAGTQHLKGLLHICKGQSTYIFIAGSTGFSLLRQLYTFC